MRCSNFWIAGHEGLPAACGDPAIARQALLRLGLSALLPLLSALIGTVLLLIQGWRSGVAALSPGPNYGGRR